MLDYFEIKMNIHPTDWVNREENNEFDPQYLLDFQLQWTNIHPIKNEPYISGYPQISFSCKVELVAAIFLHFWSTWPNLILYVWGARSLRQLHVMRRIPRIHLYRPARICNAFKKSVGVYMKSTLDPMDILFIDEESAEIFDLYVRFRMGFWKNFFLASILNLIMFWTRWNERFIYIWALDYVSWIDGKLKM